MTKHPWTASLISVITSKRVVVAIVAATALVIGVMSVGAAVLIQKRISGIADVQGAPYTPPQHPGRRTAGNAAPAVASAGTMSSRAGVKKIAAASIQTASPSASQSPAPDAPLLPGDNISARSRQAPLATPSAVPSAGPNPPGNGPVFQPLQPARLTGPFADLLSLQIDTIPIQGIRLGL